MPLLLVLLIYALLLPFALLVRYRELPFWIPMSSANW